MIRTISNMTDYPIFVRVHGHKFKLDAHTYTNSEFFPFLTPGEWARLSIRDFKIDTSDCVLLNANVKTDEGHAWEDIMIVSHSKKRFLDQLYLRKKGV